MSAITLRHAKLQENCSFNC